ncbi:MAG: class I SAM-dependent methyltransferase [Treponema sp.]|jgi:SAM-dependent methyltransferase|nr:class I SAM-dependent methyltransferase [Treponema sp.]
MFRPYLTALDRQKRILEIGPLTNPMVQKGNGARAVYYADIRSTEDVKKLYANDDAVDTSKIVDIDYVIVNSYSESLKHVEPFEYVLMSHVIEHVPELIHFFNDISTVLKDGGKLCLTIPDKRYCFDHYRMPASFAECYDIYKRGIKNNPLRVLDYISFFSMNNDPVFWWKNPTDYENIPENTETFENGVSCYERALKGEYFDVHFSVFTPESFLLIVYNMTKLRLLPFKIKEFYGTDKNTFEFNVVLEKDTRMLGKMAESESKNLQHLLERHSDNRVLLEIEKIRQRNEKLEAEFNAVVNSYNQKLYEIPAKFFAKYVKNILHK